MLFEKEDTKKLAIYWLSREEKVDTAFHESLRPHYREWKAKGYKVCVFLSGEGDLVQSTCDLLVHNKMVMAEHIVAEKKVAEARKQQVERTV